MGKAQPSITTRTGDSGETSLLFGRRVAKNHPRMCACGSVDELSASLGAIRAAATTPEEERIFLREVQSHLVALMGELAVDEADVERYRQSKIPKLEDTTIDLLEARIAKLEQSRQLAGWSYPGDKPEDVVWHQARAICRRAERDVFGIDPSGASVRPQVLIYLNRLSDYLWLSAVE